MLVVGIALVASPTNADNLKPFTSDGCSSFPDGTLEQRELWRDCCVVHDRSYWQGGTYQQRLKADQTLKQCVAKVGKPNIAKLMLAGVRVGGSPLWPTSYRWGYGWDFPKSYAELSEQEIKQISVLWDKYLMLDQIRTNGLKAKTKSPLKDKD